MPSPARAPWASHPHVGTLFDRGGLAPGSHRASTTLMSAGHRANMTRVLGWVAEGRLRPRTHATYPLAHIAEAIGVLERREATGKVIVKP